MGLYRREVPSFDVSELCLRRDGLTGAISDVPWPKHSASPLVSCTFARARRPFQQQCNAATGEILRALTLDPTKDYQPTGRPIGGPSRPYGPQERKRSKP